MNETNRRHLRPVRLTARPAIVAALAAGASQDEAAAAAGVSRSTLTRMLGADPEMRTEIDQARVAMMDDLASRLNQLAPTAIDTLGQIVANPDIAASVRVRAAEVILGGQRDRFPILQVIDRLRAAEAHAANTDTRETA